MSQENAERLRVFLELWEREPWTPEAWERGDLIDMSLLDLDVVYEDETHRVRAKARHTGIEFDAPLAYAWSFRDGKIVHFRSFLAPDDALEAAGLRQ